MSADADVVRNRIDIPVLCITDGVCYSDVHCYHQRFDHLHEGGIMYDSITQNLKRGHEVADRDKAIFNDYIHGVITLGICKERFKKNNRIVDKQYERISDEMFVNWLRSLGWKRYDISDLHD